MGEDQRLRLLEGTGEVVESEDKIIFENVPIVTPNKDIVASGLTFQVCAHSLTSLALCPG